MSKTLTIAGTNFKPQLVTNSARIRELVQNKSSVMNMQLFYKSGMNVPQEGSEVVFKDGSRFLFGGFISRLDPTETGKGYKLLYDVEVSDYSFIFNYKTAKRAYLNQTLAYIVNDLITDFVGTSYGFDLSNVDTGPTIPSIVFDHISVRKCFEKLTKVTGYVWWVDYEKKLYFKTKTSTPAPESVTDAGSNIESLSLSYDTSQVRNDVTVIGSDTGQASEAAQSNSFTGDDLTLIWKLDDRPASIASITVNGISQQFHEQKEQIDGDVFVYSADTGYFWQVDTTTPYTITDTIVVNYYPFIDIIAERKDQDSIDFFAALDGGDGIWSYTIKDQSITTKAEAGERAQKELDEFADPLVNGEFVTRTSLLSAGSYFKPGQVLTVNLPSYGISSDTTFLIQEVNTEMVENEPSGATEYIYQVRFGGKLAGVQEFLESLATDVVETNDTTAIKVLRQSIDQMELEDTGLTHSITTPPYKYGPAGSPQGKYNKSEFK